MLVLELHLGEEVIGLLLVLVSQILHRVSFLIADLLLLAKDKIHHFGLVNK